MKKRLITASILLTILGGAFALRLINVYGVYLFDLFVGVLAIFAALEFAKLLEAGGTHVNQMMTGLYPSLVFAGHVFYFVFNLSFGYYLVIQLSILLIGFLITFVSNLFLRTKEFTKYMENKKLSRLKASLKIALKTFLTFLYPTTFLLALMMLNRIDSFAINGIRAFSGSFGWVALIVTFLIPIISDSSAMLSGMLIKGPKLCPKISPKKTISGAVSAVAITSLILGALFYLFNSFNAIGVGFTYLGIKSYHFVILGFFGSIIGQAGDIFESYLKRKANVKDSGNIFPGHGGFLDRVDSHIFCAPFVLIYFISLIVF